MNKRPDLESFLNSIPENKMPQLIAAIKEGKIDSSSSELDFNKNIPLTQNQIDIAKGALSHFSDMENFLFELELIREIKSQKSRNATRLVWTSPLYDERADDTLDTLVSMIQSANYSILIVGYVVFKADKILKEISKRAKEKSNLKVRFILEKAADYSEDVLKKWTSTRYPEFFSYSPKIPRSLLHAKVVIVDKSQILITSANLTENALERNVELGIFHDSKTIAEEASGLFQALIDEGYMEPIPTV